MTMSNVIDLEARRKVRTQQPAQRNRRREGHLMTAGGFVILLPSVALLGFVAYQAVQLQLLADTFVIGLFIALAGYLAVGAVLVRHGRRLVQIRSQQTAEQWHEETSDTTSDERNEENPFRLVEFPTAGPIGGDLISIRCSSCANRYLASRTNLLCPTCGRGALAS